MTYKALFQLGTSDEDVINSLLSHIKNLRIALGDEMEILLICHAKSLDFVCRSNEASAATVRLLLSFNAGIAACENMLKSHDKSAADLHKGIETVASAIATLVVKQQEGWSYIKAEF